MYLVYSSIIVFLCMRTIYIDKSESSGWLQTLYLTKECLGDIVQNVLPTYPENVSKTCLQMSWHPFFWALQKECLPKTIPARAVSCTALWLSCHGKGWPILDSRGGNDGTPSIYASTKTKYLVALVRTDGLDLDSTQGHLFEVKECKLAPGGSTSASKYRW